MKLDKRNKLLIAGCLVLLFATYKLALSKTMAIHREHGNLKSKSIQAGDIPVQLAILAQKEQYYDSIMQQMDIGDTSIQNNLLRTINEQAKIRNVNVMDFNPPHIQNFDNHRLLTHSIVLNGGYTDILQVVYALERKGSFGDIVHVDFEKKRDYRKRKSFLEATIFVQHLE
ncbi:hypothetical protein [Ulvibacterium sp.]|uniref:hypothetical protein n=1 Tax=Ulvibacterium sp. TaxID=2665914 RepID=UPI0026257016|nr:hypothetical protein [Ulvibacterium sp.]